MKMHVLFQSLCAVIMSCVYIVELPFKIAQIAGTLTINFPRLLRLSNMFLLQSSNFISWYICPVMRRILPCRGSTSEPACQLLMAPSWFPRSLSASPCLHRRWLYFCLSCVSRAPCTAQEQCVLFPRGAAV